MTTKNTDTLLKADCNPRLVVPLEIPASEGYPSGWMHCKIHLNPETGEMHSDGDHRVRHWIKDRMLAKERPVKTPKTFRERVKTAWEILRHNKEL